MTGTTRLLLFLTFPLSVLGAGQPGHGLHVAQLPADHVRGVDGEVVVAHRAPLSAVKHLHPSFVVLPLLPREPQLDLGDVGRPLGGLVYLRGWLGVTGEVGPVFILGKAQRAQGGEEQRDETVVMGKTQESRHFQRSQLPEPSPLLPAADQCR